MRHGATVAVRSGGRLIALAAMTLAAFLLRVVPAYPGVLGPGGVRLHEADPWYHLRRIEHLVANYPHVLTFDPYALWPGGQTVAVGPFFDLLVATLALVLGAGAPSSALVQQLAAWVPPILGALVVPVVYVVAARCFDRGTGLLAALCATTMPGAFLQYTLLGFADHHACEALLSGLGLLLLMRAVEGPAGAAGDAAGARGTSWLRGVAPWSLLAGVVLGAYLLSWVGGSLLVTVIFGWLVVQAVSDAAAGRTVGRVPAAVLPALVVALVIVLPYVGVATYLRFHVAALAGTVVSLPILAGMLWMTARGGHRRAGAIVGVLAWAGLGVAGFYAAAPNVARGALGMVETFLGGVPGGLVGETGPLLFDTEGRFSSGPAWNAFAVGGWLAPLGLLVLTGGVLRRWTPGRGLLLIWSVLVLLATLRQVRFGYYAGLNVAVLSALACTWLGAQINRAVNHRGIGVAVRLAAGGATALAALGPALRIARTFTGPDADWCAALEWLRTQTPEPLGDAEAYTARYGQREKGNREQGTGSRGEGTGNGEQGTGNRERGTGNGEPGTGFAWPDDAYGVLASWERGYWITALGRRIPCGNGTQAGAGETSRLLLSQDARDAARRLDALGVRYVIVDHGLRVWSAGSGRYSIGKFEHTARWAGAEPREFFELCFRPDRRGGLEPVLLYYPAYFRTLAVRLGVFGGAAVEPEAPVLAFSWRPQSGEGGRTGRVLTGVEKFATYEAAQAFVESHAAEKWRIASVSPTATCVPLEAVDGLAEVYASSTVLEHAAGRRVPEVRVFERRR